MTLYAWLTFLALCAATAVADEEAADKAAPAEASAQITNSIGMTLVPIPAGTFQMGSPDREPGRNNNERQVEVTITKPFLISDTEVTQKQWTEVMGNSPWALGQVEDVRATARSETRPSNCGHRSLVQCVTPFRHTTEGVS